MKNIILIVVACFTLMGQTTNSFTVISATTITVVAGGITCTFVNQNPALPSGVSYNCVSGSNGSDGKGNVPVGASNGYQGSYHVAGDAITWMFTQPTVNVISYQIAYNGIMKSGSF